VDDENEVIEHIPDQIRLTFYLNHPEYEVGELTVTENGEHEIISCFELKCLDGAHCTVEYRIVEKLPSRDGWKDVDVAIFDYLRVHQAEALIPFDKTEILEVVERLGRQKVFIFTGYPEEAGKALRDHIEDENFITKPGDALAIAEQIVVQIIDSISQRTK
jgi:hypothetical protein